MTQASSVDTIPLIAALTASSFYHFIKMFWLVAYGDPFQDSKLINILAEHLQALQSGQIKRLALALPVRHGKSSQTQVMFPAWLWCKDPTLRIMSATYSKDLTERDSLRSRTIINSPLYQACFGHLFKLAEDQNRKDYYANDQLGHRLALSISTATAGKDADIIICDDLHDYASRNSEAELRTAKDYFWTTLSSRLVPGKDRIIVCGHRVSDADIFGDIYNTYGNDGTWTYLVLPAEGATSTTYFNHIGWIDHRQPEDLLCPERFSKEWYAAEKRKLRNDYSLQYQQDPTPAEGNLFKSEWFQTYTHQEENYKYNNKTYPRNKAWRFATSDLALSTTKGSDYSVCQVWDVVGPNLFLVHQMRQRLDGTKIIPALYSIWQEYRPDFIAVESEFAGLMVIDQLREKDVTVKKFRSKDHGDKEVRSIPAQVKAEGGNIWLPINKDFVADFLKEITSFPNGRHDDCVDSFTMAVILAQKYGGIQEEDQIFTAEEREEAARKAWVEMLHGGL